jgi:hypothetical protein
MNNQNATVEITNTCPFRIYIYIYIYIYIKDVTQNDRVINGSIIDEVLKGRGRDLI